MMSGYVAGLGGGGLWGLGVTIGDFWGVRWLTRPGLCVSDLRKRVGA